MYDNEKKTIYDKCEKYNSEICNNTRTMQLTDLYCVSKSLDKVQQMIDEEVIREQS